MQTLQQNALSLKDFFIISHIKNSFYILNILLHILGSIEQLMSGPFLLRVSVKCFSITQAHATDASTATDPTE